jgi:hypothetical protein
VIYLIHQLTEFWGRREAYYCVMSKLGVPSCSVSQGNVYEQGHPKIRSQGRQEVEKHCEGRAVYPRKQRQTMSLHRKLRREAPSTKHHLYRKSGLFQPSVSGVTDGVNRKGFVHRTPEKLSWWQDRDDWLAISKMSSAARNVRHDPQH